MPPSCKYGKRSLKSHSFVILGFSELSCNTKGFALFLLPKIIFLQISTCLTLPSFRSLLKCPLPSQWESQYIWKDCVRFTLKKRLSIWWEFNEVLNGTSLVVQRLRFHVPDPRVMGSIPCQELRFHMPYGVP